MIVEPLRRRKLVAHLRNFLETVISARTAESNHSTNGKLATPTAGKLATSTAGKLPIGKTNSWRTNRKKRLPGNCRKEEMVGTVAGWRSNRTVGKVFGHVVVGGEETELSTMCTVSGEATVGIGSGEKYF